MGNTESEKVAKKQEKPRKVGKVRRLLNRAIRRSVGRHSVFEWVRYKWEWHDLKKRISKCRELIAGEEAEREKLRRPMIAYLDRLPEEKGKAISWEEIDAADEMVPQEEVKAIERKIEWYHKRLGELFGEHGKLALWPLLREADRYFIPVPDSNRLIGEEDDPEDEPRCAVTWEDYDYHWGLTGKERRDLLKALDDKRRERRKARRELFVQIVSLLTGLIGTLIGLISALKSGK